MIQGELVAHGWTKGLRVRGLCISLNGIIEIAVFIEQMNEGTGKNAVGDKASSGPCGTLEFNVPL